MHTRSETAGPAPAHREQYHLASARAVAQLHVLDEYMLPLLRLGRLMLPHKGTDPAAEVADAANALGILGGRFRQTFPVTIPNLNAARHLVLIEKTRPTPKAYPRKAGTPAKKPIA